MTQLTSHNPVPSSGPTGLTFERLRHVLPGEDGSWGHRWRSDPSWGAEGGCGDGGGAWRLDLLEERSWRQDGAGLLGQEVQDVLLQDASIFPRPHHFTELDLRGRSRDITYLLWTSCPPRTDSSGPSLDPLAVRAATARSAQE